MINIKKIEKENEGGGGEKKSENHQVGYVWYIINVNSIFWQ